MSISEKIYGRLQRITNTTNFIPQIDGLRFLAIMMVVLYHINIFVTVKVPFNFGLAVRSRRPRRGEARGVKTLLFEASNSSGAALYFGYGCLFFWHFTA